MQAAVQMTGANWVRLRTLLKHARKDPVRKALEQMGLYLAARVQQNIRNGRIGNQRIRANAPATIAKKRSRKPLIDTAVMLGSIQTWQGESQNVQRVGIPAGLRHSDPRREIAQVAIFHEGGTVLTEARPFLLPTVLLEFDRLREMMASIMGIHLRLSLSEYTAAVVRR